MTTTMMDAVARFATAAGIAAMLCAVLLTAWTRLRAARRHDWVWYMGRQHKVEKVTWRRGDTHTVILQGRANACQSRLTGEEEYLWRLADGRVMYAPRALQAQIEAGDFRDGDSIEIVKNTMGWDVRRAYKTPIGQSGPHEPIPRAAPTVEPAETPQPRGVQTMVRAPLMAVAISEAMHCATIAGFQATSEDIRALAITIFIEKQRSGRSAAA